MRTLSFILGMLLLALSVQAQNANSPHEGLCAELSTTPGNVSIRWWGKSGRTYFVQTSETLLPDSWTYLPEVRAGSDALEGLGMLPTQEKLFVRLVYTDAAYSGTAAGADFDGDGLTNAQEVAVGWGTDPFIVDTDSDGWTDKMENQYGGSGTSALSSPATANPNFGEMLRTYESQTMSGHDSYAVSQQGTKWQWGQNWYVPGIGAGFDGQQNLNSRPMPALHPVPFTLAFEDTYWVTSYNAPWTQDPNPPLTYIGDPTYLPYAQYGYKSTSTNENSYWGVQWCRHRLKLSQPLPVDYTEHYLRVTWSYTKDVSENSDGYWHRGDISSIAPVTMTVPQGTLESAWTYLLPTSPAQNEMLVTQFARVKVVLRANPNGLLPPSPSAMFTPAPENQAHDKLVEEATVDRLGKLPMGQGRKDGPGDAYAAPVEVYAIIPDLPGVGWRWKRNVSNKTWAIRLENGQMVGTLVYNNLTQDDTPVTNTTDITRSEIGRIYTGDSSGVDLSDAAVIPSQQIAYEERQFEYWLEATWNAASTYEVGLTPVAQRMTMLRNTQTGNLAQDFLSGINTNFIGRLDLQLSAQEALSAIRAGYSN